MRNGIRDIAYHEGTVFKIGAWFLILHVSSHGNSGASRDAQWFLILHASFIFQSVCMSFEQLLKYEGVIDLENLSLSRVFKARWPVCCKFLVVNVSLFI